MIARGHDLPVARQAQLLNISRGGVYYVPRCVSPVDLALMRRIDELHLDYPFAGARMLRDLLAGEGIQVGRLHVSTPDNIAELSQRTGLSREELLSRLATAIPSTVDKLTPGGSMPTEEQARAQLLPG